MAQLFLFVFDDDAMEPGLVINGPRPAKADVAAAQALQLDRDVLENVGRIRAAVEPLEKAPHFPHAAAMLNRRWQPTFDAFVEAGDLTGARLVVWPQIDPSLQHRKVSPDVGTAERQNLAKFHWCRVPVNARGSFLQRWLAGSRFLLLGKP